MPFLLFLCLGSAMYDIMVLDFHHCYSSPAPGLPSPSPQPNVMPSPANRGMLGVPSPSTYLNTPGVTAVCQSVTACLHLSLLSLSVCLCLSVSPLLSLFSSLCVFLSASLHLSSLSLPVCHSLPLLSPSVCLSVSLSLLAFICPLCLCPSVTLSFSFSLFFCLSI